jgi:hypothetical protein
MKLKFAAQSLSKELHVQLKRKVLKTEDRLKDIQKPASPKDSEDSEDDDTDGKGGKSMKYLRTKRKI